MRKMAHDYFAILGLAPGRYSEVEIAQRFDSERTRLIAELDRPRHHVESRRQLEALHLAYSTLRDPTSQAAYLEAGFGNENDVTAMRRLIAASLEGGLLRYSRRRQILEEGRRRAFSDFQTQLLIAQVQFGDDQFAPVTPGTPRPAADKDSRAWARFAAVGVLALALFLALVRWLAT